MNPLVSPSSAPELLMAGLVGLTQSIKAPFIVVVFVLKDSDDYV